MPVALVSSEVQSSYRETLTRRQGAVATDFTGEWQPELEKRFSKATAGPTSSSTNRECNVPQGKSPPRTPERLVSSDKIVTIPILSTRTAVRMGHTGKSSGW